MKVIVLGTGSMGAAACAQLARRGHEVLGLDRYAPPHDLGSHHGESRMIRQSYGEHPEYVPLLLRSYELWRELETLSGEPLMFETGGLYMGPPGAEMVEGALLAATQHGLPYELLDAEGIRQRYPVFGVPDDFVGFHEQRAGYVIPEKAIAAQLRVAGEAGAVLHQGQAVVAWDLEKDRVVVHTEDAVHRADRLVITAGAWAEAALGEIGLPLEVTRQVLAWVDLGDHSDREAYESMPGWFCETDRPYGYYGFPLPLGGRELKFALHAPGRSLMPDDYGDETVDDEELKELSGFARRFLGAPSEAAIRTRMCRYTNTPDGHFAIGLHPADSRVCLAAGFSGHGFKFATVVGEVLADLAETGESRHPMSLFDPRRFAE